MPLSPERFLVQNVPHENEFDLHEIKLIELIDEQHFHNNRLAPRLVLMLRQRTTLKGIGLFKV